MNNDVMNPDVLQDGLHLCNLDSKEYVEITYCHGNLRVPPRNVTSPRKEGLIKGL